jgi:hypothetical protein
VRRWAGTGPSLLTQAVITLSEAVTLDARAIGERLDTSTMQGEWALAYVQSQVN